MSLGHLTMVIPDECDFCEDVAVSFYMVRHWSFLFGVNHAFGFTCNRHAKMIERGQFKVRENHIVFDESC